jgi:hypothetical protein
MPKWPRQSLDKGGAWLTFVVGQDWPAHDFKALFTSRDAESAYIKDLGIRRYTELPQEVQDVLNLEV